MCDCVFWCVRVCVCVCVGMCECLCVYRCVCVWMFAFMCMLVFAFGCAPEGVFARVCVDYGWGCGFVLVMAVFCGLVLVYLCSFVRVCFVCACVVCVYL